MGSLISSPDLNVLPAISVRAQVQAPGTPAHGRATGVLFRFYPHDPHPDTGAGGVWVSDAELVVAYSQDSRPLCYRRAIVLRAEPRAGMTLVVSAGMLAPFRRATARILGWRRDMPDLPPTAWAAEIHQDSDWASHPLMFMDTGGAKASDWLAGLNPTGMYTGTVLWSIPGVTAIFDHDHARPWPKLHVSLFRDDGLGTPVRLLLAGLGGNAIKDGARVQPGGSASRTLFVRLDYDPARVATNGSAIARSLAHLFLGRSPGEQEADLADSFRADLAALVSAGF